MKKKFNIQFTQYNLIVMIIECDEIKSFKTQHGFLSLNKNNCKVGMITPLIYKHKMKCTAHNNFENCYTIPLD